MKKLLFVLVFSSTVPALSQKQGNIWYFGFYCGLDFNSGNPVELFNGQTYGNSHSEAEGTASHADSSGNLLFYTNGSRIWNRRHQVMPNGDSLLGNQSSTQAALILPRPGSSQYYYVFTTSDYLYQNLENGFRYSVVDMCLDSGRGDVITSQKNILVLDTVAEKLTAVRHANGIDYWVLVHKYFSRSFYAYHLTSAGISATVVSTIGSNHPLPFLPKFTTFASGQMKASPNGQKLAAVSTNGHGIVEYFDFDPGTGVISNSVNLQGGYSIGYYGVSFSPDNSKLYVASNLNGLDIYQYDLNAGSGNPDSVKASRIAITHAYKSFWGLQLAPNGKIYVTRQPTSLLGAINSPNNKGLNCNYVDSATKFGGFWGGIGLPNFVDSYDYHNESLAPALPLDATSESARKICAPGGATLSAISTSTIYWYNSPTATVSLGTGSNFVAPALTPGTYTYYAESFECTSSLSRTAITFTVLDCTTLSEHHSEKNILIAPNPFDSKTTVTIIGAVIDELEFYDSQGRCLRKCSPASQDQTLLIEDLSPGMYFIKVTSGSKSTVQKVVVAR
jgi:hypothetical protein